MCLDLQSDEDLRVAARKEAEIDNSTTDFGLEDFTYRNNIIAETMFGHLNRTNFTGITVSCCSNVVHVIVLYAPL